ncbi:MAG: TusE/DsrC/DsvC family sulfur relay protein [Gammaproteobacteria bacterium]|jgi:tRNA 2-thiouridine synthesizing protein E
MAEEMTDKEKMEFVFRVHEDEADVEQWDRKVAAELAKKEGIELSDERWDVVSYLRKYFEEFGTIDYARDLSVILNQKFESKGGLKYLYTLFPKGPVSQGCKIAGIPVPTDSKDTSFGNVS